ncbi:hypothetical protein CEXT_368781 [Caerostris extrusa]|uniref:Uncharacterized protein n=1 Tax=Caerostris extrusa TaxID=172846 RepID=A0AAV4Q5E1_CAEEX|nr:hypothetical protein CEXT_368781 [Caerostris extrusa]
MEHQWNALTPFPPCVNHRLKITATIERFWRGRPVVVVAESEFLQPRNASCRHLKDACSRQNQNKIHSIIQDSRFITIFYWRDLQLLVLL